MEFKPGLIIGEERGTDYVFLGGQLDRTKILPGGDWRPYLPTPEAQATRVYDPYSCVSMSFNNVIETHLMKMMESEPEIKTVLEQLQALDDNGRPNFSDRWLAKMSGTIPGRGTTMDAVFDSVRKYGLVGEKVWPKGENMGEDEYYKDIPQDIQEKGKEFLKYFDFGYEALPYSNFMVKFPSESTLNDALEYSPIWCCVDGRYEYDENGLIGELGKAIAYNHATTNVAKSHWVFDSYDPFLKQFVTDYKFGYCKSIDIKFKKKIMKLIKENGYPAVYLYVGELDGYFGIADTEINGIKIDGGSWFKTFCGKYSNAGIEKVDSFNHSKIIGNIKPEIFK